MAVRRKSNWYIYIIAFLITMAFVLMVIFSFRWFLFPEKTEEAGLTSAGELSDSFQPTAADSFTILAMLAEDELSSPTLFLLTIYNAVESTVTFVPFPAGASVGSEGRDLTNVYAAKGGAGVTSAVSDITGIGIDGYVKLTKAGFIDFSSAVGNVQFDVPKTTIISDDKQIETINQGTQLLSSERLYKYIMYADFGNGESGRFNIIGSVLSELVNQNYSFADSMQLDTWAQMLIGQNETDITTQMYSAKKAALLNTIMYATSPAEYYVPYGTYGDDGSFELSETSVITLRQKAGLE